MNNSNNLLCCSNDCYECEKSHYDISLDKVSICDDKVTRKILMSENKSDGGSVYPLLFNISYFSNNSDPYKLESPKEKYRCIEDMVSSGSFEYDIESGI